MCENIKLLYIDLFCGAGGTSTGVESAKINEERCAKVIACVNHDANAIASHAANHPEALHFTEDIRTLELSPLVKHLELMKIKYPNALIVLWASLECTNFSMAKGGMPRDADSRTLAEHLFRYIEALNPNYVQIENVEEFMSWGDMDENGKPLSRDKGRSYQRWVSSVKKYGYWYDYKILNSANYGAYTSRKRFFGIFAKENLPIIFPEATHSKKVENGLFDSLEKWKPVKEVLDFSDEGVSIFVRKKPLSEKTLERIYAGLIKFVAGGKDKWLLKYNSINKKTGRHIPPGIDDPCPTVSCQGRLGLVGVKFISTYYGNGSNFPMERPAPVVTTKDRLSLVSTQFLDKQYGTGRAASVEQPASTITSTPKLNLVSCKPWIMNTNFNNMGSSINEPAQTITANRKWHYLMNPQFNSAGGSVDNPCFTLIARMDKMPPYLVDVKSGCVSIPIFATDSENTVKIKKFMNLYGIVDVKMRMLKIIELKRIMGFPGEYILIGTKADQKKFIGNAVEVTMARVLCEALSLKLIAELKKVA